MTIKFYDVFTQILVTIMLDPVTAVVCPPYIRRYIYPYAASG